MCKGILFAVTFMVASGVAAETKLQSTRVALESESLYGDPEEDIDADEDGDEDGPVGDEYVIQRSAPIMRSFPGAHARCARGCSYVSWGIWGDKAHRARKSCHNSGEAIDIHAIRCGGRTFAAGSARFNQYVGCMRGSFKVIFGSGRHKNHAHIQLRGCRKVGG